jgi:hypothetical protein
VARVINVSARMCAYMRDLSQQQWRSGHGDLDLRRTARGLRIVEQSALVYDNVEKHLLLFTQQARQVVSALD